MSHSKLFSPSKAEGWFACAGRPLMEAPFPDTGNASSDDGTARHGVVAECLRSGMNCDDLVGYHVELATGAVFMPDTSDTTRGKSLEYREEWVDEDQDYVDTFRRLAEGGELHVEQRLDFRRFIECTSEDDGFGTGDVVILKPLADGTYELIVGDRKTGYHEVPVEGNKQLLLYALGAYDEHSLVYDISRVRLIIHQRAAREWDCAVEDLLAFGQTARSRAITVMNAVSMHGKVDQGEWERTFLNQEPSEDACRYCKAMATCPSMQRKVQEVVDADFDELAAGEADVAWMPKAGADLGKLMAATGLIEDWIKAVRAEVERRLLAGEQVPGFKLVLGKAGNRKWSDEEAAKKMLRDTFRLPIEKAFDLSLISPTSAEKLHKAGDIGKKQWPKLQPLISRADPKPSVAPASDKREPYTPPKPSADDFEAVADQVTDLA